MGEIIVSVTVWESFDGTKIGAVWTANPKELILLALLKIVSYDYHTDHLSAAIK